MRWFSVEFLCYYAIIVFAYYNFFTIGHAFSQDFKSKNCWDSNQDNCLGLKRGIFGWHRDAADIQWNSFYNNLPTLFALMIAYVTISQISRRLGVTARLWSCAAVSLAVVIFVHRSEAPWGLFIVTVNYLIAKVFGGSRLNPLLSWIFAAGYMVYSEHVGFSFGRFSDSLEWLDEWQPTYRFARTINLCLLRMISFNMDYYWALRKQPSSRKSLVEDEWSYDARVETHQPLERYSFVSYFVYLFYIPVMITGPTIAYNAFISQVHRPQTTQSSRYIVVYALRFVISFLILEVGLRFFYLSAIVRYGNWSNWSAAQVATLGYLTLNFLWLKFLLLWKFARLWALVDGVDCPENMARCVNNNYTMSGFWRAWHRSFNRWLLRYVYIPLGGQKWYALNIWVVFTFVALWHDMTIQLLKWSWLVCIFLLIEWVGQRISHVLNLPQSSWYRQMCGLAAALNITLMMAANLVGFGVGSQGVSAFLIKMVADWQVFVAMIVIFYAAAMVMFEVRVHEVQTTGRKVTD
eukprot:TRINITY_DN10799_c0_g1_i1.p1 TRINITY_DN10799_c0_g1~~TRINITY_DN10799_c0_g1_i1.p1  ORF type:complete len:520 (-),score=81.97 TRINITY_DN10799_c0_g1_i1:61-1620(-)